MEKTATISDDDSTGTALLCAHSRLVQLPVEVLQSTVHYCLHCSLPSIACISPELRARVERQLYCDVVLGWKSKITTQPRDLWPFYRTLQSRSDLARRVESLNIEVVDRTLHVDVPASGVIPQGPLFPSTIRAELDELYIAGALPLYHMTELTSLDLSIVHDHEFRYDDGRFTLVSEYLNKLFSGFDSLTAHLTPFPGLQKLRSLKFQGTEFHWVFAKSPYLEQIHHTRASQISADGASSEVNATLKTLELPVHSAVLYPACIHYDALSPFLAHLPRLRTLRMPFNDADYGSAGSCMDFFLNSSTQGSYSILLQKLQPVAAVLTRLELDVSTHCGEVDTFFLGYVLLGDGFLDFKALKHLLVPYQCLLPRETPQWSHILQPANEILPPSLETLKVHLPEHAFLDWLTTLSYYGNKLSVLQRIGIACSSWVGASYEDLVFISYPHPALTVLSSMNIDWSIDVPTCCWDRWWDDYDFRTWDAVAWMDRTYGPSYRGTVFHPTHGDHSELVAPPVTIEEEAKSVDAADSSVMQYTASELDISLEATTTLLHDW
ncbi:hypothetical protein BKA58DRAFT_328465 [Alternaria rosae]|uniref:uncharacterized protein n=1 Tax=Alternaria rosae TaxID=1187941 RepID=UPI001E8CF099|nr:uncharacterized protein BKA58DRAFT_328465 [Alternaria rosae]KAH6882062.1 hypothetical protein BKA58DRAFT_328465 [Alternaria rosae]